MTAFEGEINEYHLKGNFFPRSGCEGEILYVSWQADVSTHDQQLRSANEKALKAAYDNEPVTLIT